MKKILQKTIDAFEFITITPDAVIPSREGKVSGDHTLNINLLCRLKEARDEAFKTEGYSPDYNEKWPDKNAHHIIAFEKATNNIVGGIRLFIMDSKTLSTDDMLNAGGIDFKDHSLRLSNSKPIAEIIKATATAKEPTCYAGGFFVAKPYRKTTGIAPFLALATCQVAHQEKCRIGITFASHKNNAIDLLLKIGQGEKLSEPFFCEAHNTVGQLISWRSIKECDHFLDAKNFVGKYFAERKKNNYNDLYK